MILQTDQNPQRKTIFQAILARHSVRAYTQDKPAHSTVQTLLEAAVRAPRAMHVYWICRMMHVHVLMQGHYWMKRYSSFVTSYEK